MSKSLNGRCRMEKVNYLGQPNCYRLSNGTVEVIVSTDVGPRILRYGFVGEENVLGEYPDLKVTSELGEWTAYGGHRLWTAPEAMPRTYSPDSLPVEFRIDGDRTIRSAPAGRAKDCDSEGNASDVGRGRQPPRGASPDHESRLLGRGAGAMGHHHHALWRHDHSAAGALSVAR